MTALQAPQPTFDRPRHSIGDAAFDALARLLRDETGIVLSESKKGLAVSRLSRRLRDLGLPDFDAYCALLSSPDGPAEMQEMILLLTTNVTRFFREGHHFDQLRTAIFPGLAAKAKSGGRVRIWSAGCSSGEEPYSIAMTALAAVPRVETANFRILATDIDRNVLSVGRTGRYKISAEDRGASPLMAKYMDPVAGSPDTFEVSDKLRAMVQFAELNLQNPWPMQGKFDVIFCRNVVIYFSTETQQALWPRFAGVLNPGGHLMIGHSERVTGLAAARLKSCGVTQYQLTT